MCYHDKLQHAESLKAGTVHVCCGGAAEGRTMIHSTAYVHNNRKEVVYRICLITPL